MERRLGSDFNEIGIKKKQKKNIYIYFTKVLGLQSYLKIATRTMFFHSIFNLYFVSKVIWSQLLINLFLKNIFSQIFSDRIIQNACYSFESSYKNEQKMAHPKRIVKV